MLLLWWLSQQTGEHRLWNSVEENVWQMGEGVVGLSRGYTCITSYPINTSNVPLRNYMEYLFSHCHTCMLYHCNDNIPFQLETLQ